MQTYISILRGINVSGHKKIEMVRLKAMYEELSFTGVITYIQSGNVIFQTSKQNEGEVVQIIEEKIIKRFGFEVPVILRTLPEMLQVVMNNPWTGQHDIDKEKLHVTFLRKHPKQSHVTQLQKMDYSPDQFVHMEREIFLYCPGSYGHTKLNNNFFENKLGVTATTRNWKTVNKLVELASKI